MNPYGRVSYIKRFTNWSSTSGVIHTFDVIMVMNFQKIIEQMILVIRKKGKDLFNKKRINNSKV